MITDKQTPACFKELFREIKDVGYANIGAFYQNLSDADLFMILNHSDILASSEDQDVRFESESFMIRGGIALCLADGMEVSVDNITSASASVSIYAACESLNRRGLIEVFRNEWSAIPDSAAVIARKMQ